jgi:L-ascorbate metabolism protein UlaG (beta-lactamase superfamily)
LKPRHRGAGIIPIIVLAAVTVLGCVEVEKRLGDPGARTIQSLRLSQSVTISTWEAGKTMWKLASCRIDATGIVVYIDPVDIVEPRPADLVLITHSHEDHLSLKDIAAVLKPGTTVVCPNGVKVDIPGVETVRMLPGEVRELGVVKCEAVPAYNLVHQRGLSFLGYVVTIDGVRVYHAGDTGPIPEMDAIRDIDAALIPIATDFLTMSPEKAARVVDAIRPRVAIPIHYELGKGKAERFRDSVKGDTEVVIMEQAARR